MCEVLLLLLLTEIIVDLRVDTNNVPLNCRINALPGSGTLYELAHNYLLFGYLPARGPAITTAPFPLLSGARQAHVQSHRTIDS